MSTMAEALRASGVLEQFGGSPASTPHERLTRAAVGVTLAVAGSRAADELWACVRALHPALPPRWADGEHALANGRVTAVQMRAADEAVWRLTVESGSRLVVDVAESDTVVVGVRVEGPETAWTAALHPVLRTLAGIGARLDGAPLASVPLQLTSREEVGSFVDRLLDPERDLPVLLITAFTRRSGEFAIDPAAAAQACLGLATVVAIPGWSDTFALSERLMKLGCYAGGVRIYWPGLSLGDLLEAHPLILGARVVPETLDAIVWRLAAWSASHHEVPEVARRLLSERVRSSAVQSAIASALQAVVDAGADAASPATDAPAPAAEAEADDVVAVSTSSEAPAATVGSPASVAMLEEVATLAGHVADLRATLEEAERAIAGRDERIRELEAQVQVLRAHLAARDDPYSGAEVTLPEPESIEEAVIQGEDYFLDELAITESARRSALRMNSADNRPAKVWKALCDLARVVRRWRSNDLPQGIAGALREMGWDPHSVSDTAIGQHTSSYCLLHDGAIVTLRHSLQLSRGERVYWAQDEENRRFVIGQIGQHLPDSTTG